MWCLKSFLATSEHLFCDGNHSEGVGGVCFSSMIEVLFWTPLSEWSECSFWVMQEKFCAWTFKVHDFINPRGDLSRATERLQVATAARKTVGAVKLSKLKLQGLRSACCVRCFSITFLCVWAERVALRRLYAWVSSVHIWLGFTFVWIQYVSVFVANRAPWSILLKSVAPTLRVSRPDKWKCARARREKKPQHFMKYDDGFIAQGGPLGFPWAPSKPVF